MGSGISKESAIVASSNEENISISQLCSLKTIGLCSQSLVKIHETIRLLEDCETMQLCCNNLTSIPLELGFLTSLTILSLARNDLTSIPSTFSLLVNLKDLNLAENQLTHLPPTLSTLTKLEFLYLEHNKLTTIPKEIAVPSLSVINLSNNLLTFIPSSFTKLKNLRKILLDENPLLSTTSPDSLEIDIQSSAPSLKELCARYILRHQIPILRITSADILHYLAEFRQCCFCQGPYYTPVRRRRVWEREFGGTVSSAVIEYELCCAHWNTDEERINALFCGLPDTAPSAIPLNSSTLSLNSFSVTTTPPAMSRSASVSSTQKLTRTGSFLFKKEKKESFIDSEYAHPSALIRSNSADVLTELGHVPQTEKGAKKLVKKLSKIRLSRSMSYYG
ncbi:hypothetical protein HK098_005284 [Nowakowskiella sp. JEL0407]|nr:hypothetical protein HK098_005284 [Nowakowskiella sp. JEL0407]